MVDITPRHPFLSKPGVWRAEGSFRDERGALHAASGRTHMQHGPMAWTIDGTITVESDPPVTLRHRYEIEPLASGSDATRWVSQNPAIGMLRGSFTVVSDTILSAYRSEDGAYHGVESLHMVTPTMYEARGVLLQGDRRISSWSVRLTLED